MPSDGELYTVLGLDKNASTDEIKKAFRRKAVQCHPDKHPGDKAKEDEFKKINDAYSILSDADKRKRYDMFGVVDDMPGGGGGHGPDLSDIFAGMFGGGAMPGAQSFSFSFGGDGFPGGGMPGGMPGGIPEDIFERMFGGGGPGGPGGPPRGHRKPADIIEIGVDICDLYYGKTRKVEFEMVDLCNKCSGTGASDPSGVIKCMTCDGRGNVMQQLGPFMVQSGRCPNCGGKGTTVRSNKICGTCKGNRTHFVKRSFELKIPPGIPQAFEIRMEDKGSYDERIKCNKDMVFRFVYQIAEPYSIQGTNVHITVPLTIEDVLAGFEKKVKIYNEEYTIRSDVYFNPQKPFVFPGLGLPTMDGPNGPNGPSGTAGPSKHGDLVVNFKVEFTDNEKLKKHNQVLRKMLKRGCDPLPEAASSATSSASAAETTTQDTTSKVLHIQ
jgi:molecular chaperone DnaJ